MLACAQALGIVCADVGLVRAGGALAVLLVATAGALAAPSTPVRCVGAMLVFFAVGVIGLDARLAAARANAPRVPVRVVVESGVCALERGASVVAVELCGVVSVSSAPDPVPLALPDRIRVVEAEGTDGGRALGALAPGDRIRARLRVRAHRPVGNPGAGDRRRRLERRGVGATAGLVHPRLVVRIAGAGAPPAWRAGQGLGREALRDRLARRLVAAGPGGGLLAALAVGERRGLAPVWRDAFRRLGIAHLLAVSGLHLAIAAGLAYAVALAMVRRMPSVLARCDGRVLSFGVAVLAVGAYAGLAGWGVPVRRAWLVLAAAALGLMLGRGRAAGPPLAAAAIGILWWQPATLFEPGPQLSFAATAALVGSVRAIGPDPVGRAWRTVVGDGLRATATAVAATAPILAAHGLEQGPAGLFANAIAVPWTALVLLPVSFGGAAAAAVMEAACPLDAAPVPLACTAGAWLLAGAEWTGRLTGASAAALASHLPALAGPPPPAWSIAVAVLLALLAVRAAATSTRMVLAAVSSMGLSFAGAWVGATSVPRLVVLDVGLGDAVVVQGRSAAILVDGGLAVPGGPDLGRSVVRPALRALSVRALDLVVATHADADHRGGLEHVLEHVPVRALWLPAGRGGDPGFARLRALADLRGVRVEERGAGDPTARFGDVAITAVWPLRGAAHRQIEGRNDGSLVLRIEVEGLRVLLTGDAGVAAERALLGTGVDLRADVLKVGHHGSAGSSSAAFLARVGASVAVASAPCDVRSLPAAATLGRLQAAGMAVWWTGRDGAVVAVPRRPAGAAVWPWAAAASRCSGRPRGSIWLPIR